MSAPDYAAMKRLLAVECEAVIEALANQVAWEGGEMHAHFPNGMSVVVAMRGAKRGVWLDKSDLSGGDMLELVHRVLGKEDHRAAYDWGKRFLGLPDTHRWALFERRQAIRERQAAAIDEKRLRIERVRRAIARYIGNSRPYPQARPIEDYLAYRGIPLELLPGVPKTLRFAEAEYHRESSREWPAMLAPIVDPLARQIIAVHTTFLHEETHVWRKAPIEPAKKVSGPYKAGVIPLLRGASGKPLWQAPEGDTVLIAEGIENALAAVLVLLRHAVLERAPRVWAAIAAPNLPHVQIPKQFAEVILIEDRDPQWRENVRRAYDRAERNWLEAGLAVTRQQPPEGFKDFAAAAAGVMHG